MEPNCHVDIILVVFAHDPLNRSNLKFLAESVHHKVVFPTNPLETTAFDAASKLLDKYAGLQAKNGDVGWIKLDQNLIIDSPKHISVVYFAVIPEVVEIKQGNWYSVLELNQFDLSDEMKFILSGFSNPHR